MTHLYTCQISGKEFDSKEALMEHYLANYVVQKKQEDEMSSMRQTIQSAFPASSVGIQKNRRLPGGYDILLLNLPYKWKFRCTIFDKASEVDVFHEFLFSSDSEMIAFIQARIHQVKSMLQHLNYPHLLHYVMLRKGIPTYRTLSSPN